MTKFSFHEKSLFITGANGSIGKAVATRFVEAGGRVLLADLTRPDALAASLDASGERAVAIRMNAASMEDAIAAAEFANSRFGGIDVIVPAAGIYEDVLARDMTADDWRRTISVNLDGVFNTCRAGIPLLREGGSIVAIASIAAHRGSAFHSHYAAAKGGVLSFIRSLSIELAPHFRANAVSPGVIDTPLVSGLMATAGSRILASTPMGRLGTADEVAQATLFLASNAASYITGETLHVNGGGYIQ